VPCTGSMNLALPRWTDFLARDSVPYLPKPVCSGASRVAAPVSSPVVAPAVALIIKKRPGGRGALDPRGFAGHSLRSRYATQAARDGHHPTQVAATARHKTNAFSPS
jgi:hypothetical protein